MHRQPNRLALLALLSTFALLGSVFFAGSAAAIFLPCDDTCFAGTSGNARCSYYQGDGSCPAYPNPCYMTCSKYWSCTSGPSLAIDEPTTVSVDGQDVIAFGADIEDWIETMAHWYGPCLELVADEDSDTSERLRPAEPAIEAEPATFEER